MGYRYEQSVLKNSQNKIKIAKKYLKRVNSMLSNWEDAKQTLRCHLSLIRRAMPRNELPSDAVKMWRKENHDSFSVQLHTWAVTLEIRIENSQNLKNEYHMTQL